MINYLAFKKRQQGVTLLEMMIALAVSAIVLTLVAPNVQSILVKNKITAEINEMSGVLQFARFTAVDERSTTIVCPSSDFSSCGNNWDDPKIVFIDANANDARDADEPLLLSSQTIANTNNMTSSANLIRFLDIGGTDTPAIIKLCPNSNDAKYSRALIVTLQGRTRISIDADRDGTHEDGNGDNLSC